MVLVLTATLAVAGAGAFGALDLGGTDGSGGGDARPSDTTVRVTRQTLSERTEVDGRLGFGAGAPLPIKAAGTITWLPRQGSVIRRGETLLRVDDKPVVLLYGSLPMYRSLGLRRSAPPTTQAAAPTTPGKSAPATSSQRRTVTRPQHGRDVLQFETNLAALGYAGFTVDPSYTSATASAVRRWRQALGLRPTGAVGVGEVIYAPGPVRISGAAARPGDSASPGALTYTGTARTVTVSASARDAAWAARGVRVQVGLPDGHSVTGRVAAVGRQVSAAPSADGGSSDGEGDSASATMPVTVVIADQKALGRLESAPVSVEYVGRQRTNVLTVPVAALVALAGGGYGLEVVSSGQDVDGEAGHTATSTSARHPASRIVAVRTGMFADGRVEISGPAVHEGMTVRIPR